jgi:hypothetical protein
MNTTQLTSDVRSLDEWKGSVLRDSDDGTEKIMKQLQYSRTIVDPSDGCTVSLKTSIDMDKIVPLRQSVVSSLSLNQQSEALPYNVEIEQVRVAF